MNATPERPNKRRNLTRWREARLRRLSYEVGRGRATERQVERAEQLAGASRQQPESLYDSLAANDFNNP